MFEEATDDEADRRRAVELDARLDEALFAACAEGRVDDARRALNSGAFVDRADSNDQTPLFVACQNGHVAAARLCLDRGADVNRENNACMYGYGGETSLYIACMYGHADAAQLCLDRGAQVEGGGEIETPLCVAAKGGHVAAARVCLSHGADVDWETNMGCTPLYNACYDGDIEMARLLLANGADINTATFRGTTMDAARESGHEALAAWLDRIIDAAAGRTSSRSQYALVGLRALAAGNRARRREAVSGRGVLDFLFPGDPPPPLSLPDDLFPLVVKYWVEDPATATVLPSELCGRYYVCRVHEGNPEDGLVDGHQGPNTFSNATGALVLSDAPRGGGIVMRGISDPDTEELLVPYLARWSLDDNPVTGQYKFTLKQLGTENLLRAAGKLTLTMSDCSDSRGHAIFVGNSRGHAIFVGKYELRAEPIEDEEMDLLWEETIRVTRAPDDTNDWPADLFAEARRRREYIDAQLLRMRMPPRPFA